MHLIRPASLLLLVLTLLTFTAPLRAADDAWTQSSEHWYEMLINGAKAGWMCERVEERGDRYRTVTESNMNMDRGPQSVSIRMKSTFVETRDGKPVEVTVEQDLSSMQIVTHWVFEDDRVVQTTRQGGAETTTDLPLPEGVWLTPRAADRFARQRRDAGATEFEFRMLSPETGVQPITVTSKRTGEGEQEHDGRTIPVSIWSSTTDILPVATIEHYSADGHMLYQKTPAGGMVIEVRMTGAEEARMARGPAPEMLMELFVRPDRPLADVMKLRRLTLRVRPRQGELPELPATGAQRVERAADGSAAVLRIDLDDPLPATASEIGDEHYLGSSAMVTTSDPLVRALASSAVRDAGDADARERAELLRHHVFRHISRKDMETAFASAAETAKTKRGDCSEHAVLLCAMLRAEGIPARVASGLVYVDEFAGAQGIFGWHMWTQALIDGRWIDLDATLPVSYHAAHVLTSTASLADGSSPADLGSMLVLLGNLEIEVLEQEAAKAPKAKPVGAGSP